MFWPYIRRSKKEELKLSTIVDRLLNVGVVVDRSQASAMNDLLEVARWRQRAGKVFMASGGKHREQVWLRLQARLSKTHAVLPIVSSQETGMPKGIPVSKAPGSTSRSLADREAEAPDALFEVVKLRYAASRRLARAGEVYRDSVFARLQTVTGGRALSEPRPHVRFGRPMMGDGIPRARSEGGYAERAAVMVTLLAALTPGTSAGGLVVDFFQVVGKRAGIIEVEKPPELNLRSIDSGLIPADSVEPIALSPQEAAMKMGVTIASPSYLPSGYEPARAAYYPTSGTGEGGFYTLIYEREQVGPSGEAWPPITIWYERGGSALIIPKDIVSYVMVDGYQQECAFVSEMSMASFSGLAPGDAQSGLNLLRCEHQSVILSVTYVGESSNIPLGELSRIASSIVEW